MVGKVVPPSPSALAETWKLLKTTRPHWSGAPASGGRLLTGVLKVKCVTIGAPWRVLYPYNQRCAAGLLTESTLWRVSRSVNVPLVVDAWTFIIQSANALPFGNEVSTATSKGSVYGLTGSVPPSLQFATEGNGAGAP